MISLKKMMHSLLATLALAAACSSANALVVSGNFNDHGYSVIQLNVTSSSNVDFLYNSGISDATFSLFNAAGQHLISNDDSNGLDPHLTQTLSAGNYSLMVSYCCTLLDAIPNYSFSPTDGFNNGSYFFGNTTLANMSAFLDQFYAYSGTDYSLTMRNAELGNAVPEPESLALFSIACVGLLLARRRKQIGA
jgi:hypothetical protein